MRNDAGEIKELLKDRIEELCLRLLPDGERQGRLWVAHNPIENDYDRSPELKVALTGDKGAWKCWRSGAKGDVIRLIEYVKSCDFKDAMVFARDFLGLAHMSPAERDRLSREAKVKQKQADQVAEQNRLRKIQRAEEMFFTGEAIGASGVAETMARAYFAGRHVPLDLVPNLDLQTFRFSGSTEYWRRAQYNEQRRKVKAGPLLPAIHTAFRAPAGQVTAAHFTFLDPLIPRKARLGDDPSKLIYGEAKGGVIRLTHGPEGEPPETARHAHPLILCEGIETGLSLAIACPEARVWAGGSLSNMGNAPVWMDCVSAIVLARDNNVGNAQAQKQLAGVIERLEAANKPLTIIASHLGDDFNDLVKGEE